MAPFYRSRPVAPFDRLQAAAPFYRSRRVAPFDRLQAAAPRAGGGLPK